MRRMSWKTTRKVTKTEVTKIMGKTMMKLRTMKVKRKEMRYLKRLRMKSMWRKSKVRMRSM